MGEGEKGVMEEQSGARHALWRGEWWNMSLPSGFDVILCSSISRNTQSSNKLPGHGIALDPGNDRGQR